MFKKLIPALAFVILSAGIFITSCTSTVDPINSAVKTPGSLAVSTTTTTYNGKYTPRHVLAIWIESSTGTFVKTLMVKAQARKQYLTNWLSSTSSGNSTDAITGATLNSHGARSCIWDGTDASGNVVGDGTYKVCMELTENDGTGKFSSFTFTKGTTTDTQAPADKTSFTNVSIVWTPNVK